MNEKYYQIGLMLIDNIIIQMRVEFGDEDEMVHIGQSVLSEFINIEKTISMTENLDRLAELNDKIDILRNILRDDNQTESQRISKALKVLSEDSITEFISVTRVVSQQYEQQQLQKALECQPIIKIDLQQEEAIHGKIQQNINEPIESEPVNGLSNLKGLVENLEKQLITLRIEKRKKEIQYRKQTIQLRKQVAQINQKLQNAEKKMAGCWCKLQKGDQVKKMSKWLATLNGVLEMAKKQSSASKEQLRRHQDHSNRLLKEKDALIAELQSHLRAYQTKDNASIKNEVGILSQVQPQQKRYQAITEVAALEEKPILVEQKATKQEKVAGTQEGSIIQRQETPIRKKVQLSGIPEHILNNKLLNQAIAILPPHYNFQIHKTLLRIETLAAELKKDSLRVSLQFPQGLMLFGCIISDILREFASVPIQTVIMGDVTYGACCVDDLGSQQMNCDLLVHYGHSCLIPITDTRRKVLYVFVEIQIDIQHFVQTFVFNFSALAQHPLHLLATIQFNNSLFLAKQALLERGFTGIIIPQEKPRSAGEVLGCTSPRLPATNARNIVIFLCDGRFHMEASMIANPDFQFYQYSPYSRELTEEKYATQTMLERRSEEIGRALQGTRKRLCFILGALGRQGNTGILDRLIKKIEGLFEYMILIASEVNVELLTSVEVDFFVQIACPRLSIDWSYGTPKPLLTPFELYALIDKYNLKETYSMDYYSYNGGPWSNFYGKNVPKKGKTSKAEPRIKLEMEKCCKKEEGCQQVTCKCQQK